jgi:hypothetical protein
MNALEDAMVEAAESYSDKFLEHLTQLPREAVLDVCPVCSRPISMEHGHAVCRSGLCRYRIIEGCCQD